MSTCNECPNRANGKHGGPCSKCGTPLCPTHAYFYTDESNGAITARSRPECPICYGMRDGGVLGYRNLLLSGDYQHRVTARARFTVVMTEHGSRVTA